MVASPADAQQFGGALAVSDSEIIVGETRNQAFPGVVYVYSKTDDGSWSESAQLHAGGDGAVDYFGRALALDGTTLLVGAVAGGSQAVHVFEKEDGAWKAAGMFTADDVVDGDNFGRNVAVHHHYAAVTATGQNDGTGAVYLFKKDDSGAYQPAGKLSASDAEAGDNFGGSIQFAGHGLLVGAPGKAKGAGTVYRFKHDMDADTWNESGKIEGAGVSEGHGFGSSIVEAGGSVYVSAPRAGLREGAVYAYKLNDESEFVPSGKLVAFDSPRNAQFGASVASTGDAIIVGAPGADGSVGAIYKFGMDESGNLTGSSKWTAGDMAPRSGFGSKIAVAGGIAAVSTPGVDSGEGAVVVFENDGNSWTSSGTLKNDIKGYDSVLGGQVDCNDSSAAQFECMDVDMVSFLSVKDLGAERGIGVNDIWGWTDPQTNREYALVGRTDGTSFVDVTNASNPVFLGDLPKTPGSRTAVWRDIKVYKDHAYIVADGAMEHGMQVFDLRLLRDVENAPVTFEPTAFYDQIASAHNIVINEDTGFAYSVGSSGGGTTCGGGLHMINIQDPANPTFAGCFADITTGRRKTGYSHDAQCVVYHGPDTEHQNKEICIGSNETMLSIADVTDKENPVALSATSYPNVAYAHQGWLSEDQAFFFMNDEGDEPRNLVEGTRTLVWDVTDLDDPILVKEYIAETTTTDHNLYVRGNLMYQSNYGSGLRILDVSNPAEPKEVGFFDTTPYEGAAGSWSNYPYFESGVIIATSMKEGLFVLKKKDVEL